MSAICYPLQNKVPTWWLWKMYLLRIDSHHINPCLTLVSLLPFWWTLVPFQSSKRFTLLHTFSFSSSSHTKHRPHHLYECLLIPTNRHHHCARLIAQYGLGLIGRKRKRVIQRGAKKAIEPQTSIWLPAGWKRLCFVLRWWAPMKHIRASVAADWWIRQHVGVVWGHHRALGVGDNGGAKCGGSQWRSSLSW